MKPVEKVLEGFKSILLGESDMNLKDISKKAALEVIGKDIDEYLYKIEIAILDFPEGTDIQLPPTLLEKIEKVCDDEDIPFYIVERNSGACSVADSYAQLETYERMR